MEELHLNLIISPVSTEMVVLLLIILLPTMIDQLNTMYEKLVQSIINEMDTYLQFRDINSTMRKKYKHSKPY